MTIKRKFLVTVTKEVEIEMHPAYDDEDFRKAEVAEFNQSIFHVNSFDEIIEYAAGQIAKHESLSFVEGVGGITHWYETHWKNEPHTYDKVMETNVCISDCEIEAVE